ncbi:Rpn family recombination-promoting nuclease/putative transposase [Paenibacillus sp. GCM10027626]|uniref:Rpn family recombination-promoting nuclease/putative transposase n=1 Tax=Paenibacillus sp. GCM10027626 TaxID=3273411 RepID=UPI00362D8CDA
MPYILDHHYLPLEKYHNTFHLYEDEVRHYMLTDLLELHFIECSKFRQLPFNINDPLHRWLRFMEKHITNEQLEELMRMDDTIREAEERLAYLASDAETRRRYALREKALHDKASLLKDARDEGIKEGIERGYKQGIEQGMEQGIEKMTYEMAINMLKEGLDYKLIRRLTGLDDKQLSQLQQTRRDADNGDCNS